MVVGDETINVVWFGEAPALRLNRWHHAAEHDAALRFEQLVLGAPAAIAPPAQTATGTLQISAVVPARNAEDWIELVPAGGSRERSRTDHPRRRRLDRPHGRLAQPWVDKVIDDGGAGVAAARMMGVASASQPAIALVDADVVLPPTASRDLDRVAALIASWWRFRQGSTASGPATTGVEPLARSSQSRQQQAVVRCLRQPHSPRPALGTSTHGQLRSGEDIDLRIRLNRQASGIGVSEGMVGLHRFADGLYFAGQAMACRRGRTWPHGAQARALRADQRDDPVRRRCARPGPAACGRHCGRGRTSAGFALGNYIGLWRGLTDRSAPARGRGRKLLQARWWHGSHCRRPWWPSHRNVPLCISLAHAADRQLNCCLSAPPSS